MKSFEFKKNDTTILNIENINEKYEGIVNYSNKKLIVPNALINENLNVKIVKIQKNIAFGKIIDILKPSKDRELKPSCGNKSCIGCDFEHIKTNRQSFYKQKRLNVIFSDVYPKSIEFSSLNETEYRSKINLPIQYNQNKFNFGLYTHSSHKVTDWSRNCNVLSLTINKIIFYLKKMINRKEYELIGEINNLFVRGTEKFGFMVGISHNGEVKEALKEILVSLLSSDLNVVSVFTNQNDNQGNSIQINNPVFLDESKDFIQIELNDNQYKISPKSFFQTNLAMTKEILDDIKSFFPNKFSSVIDICSGVGILSDQLSFNERICFDLNESSFDYMSKENTETIVADIKNITKHLKNSMSVAIFDPPRKGIGSDSIELIRDKKPQLVYYLSCNPLTLYNDIKKLIDLYDIKIIKGYDMFPNTSHIEATVVLEMK